MATNEEEAKPSTYKGQFDEPCAKRRLYTDEMLEMWNLVRLSNELGTKEQCITFAEEQGLVAKEKICNIHKKPMKISSSTNKTFGSFICHSKSCKVKHKKYVRTKGTLFENIRIELPHVFYLMYCFAHFFSYERVQIEDILKNKRNQCLSSVTITDWYSYCREAIVIHELKNEKYAKKIGGPGKIVQIDESKFGKRKYDKGRQIEGCSIIGMIENNSEDLRLELFPQNSRSADDLVPLIKKHVLEGTTIYTDCSNIYDSLAKEGFIHKKVNHNDPKNRFVAEDGTNTQRIQAQWNVVKTYYIKRNYNNFENFADLIVEYLWRRKNKKLRLDPFLEIVKVVRNVFKIN